MTNSSHQDAVPIKVWFLAFLLACLFFWGGYTAYVIRDNYTIKPIKNRNKTIDHVFSNTHSTDQNTDVYILGSSLSRYALVKFNTFDSSLVQKQLKLGYKIAYRRAALISDFNSRIPDIIKEKPRSLFIESNCLILCELISSKIIRTTSLVEKLCVLI